MRLVVGGGEGGGEGEGVTIKLVVATENKSESGRKRVDIDPVGCLPSRNEPLF